MDTGEIIFLVDRTVTAPDGDEDIVFEKGKKYKLSITSCERWIRRRLAVYADAYARGIEKGTKEIATVLSDPDADPDADDKGAKGKTTRSKG